MVLGGIGARGIGLLLILLSLSGCVTRSGVPLEGTLSPALAYAYIPLQRPSMLLPESDAGAVALGGGIAVTAAHAEALLSPKSVVGISRDYDLMFFRTDRDRAVLQTGVPQTGQKVFAIAQYEGQLYRAEGVVTALEVPVKPRCEVCGKQTAFVFEGNAGPGYSGGPVIDTASGALIGIVFGYTDEPDGKRRIYAYPMRRVTEELKAIKAP